MTSFRHLALAALVSGLLWFACSAVSLPDIPGELLSGESASFGLLATAPIATATQTIGTVLGGWLRPKARPA